MGNYGAGLVQPARPDRATASRAANRAATRVGRVPPASVSAASNPSSRVVTREDGTPALVGWYSDEFGRLVATAGVAAGALHAARHTAASLMAHLSFLMVVAAAWLG